MQGYGTMAYRGCRAAPRRSAINRPTHVFVQAGVGSLAGAVVGYFTNLYPDDPPTFVVVECAAGRLPLPGRCRPVTASPRIVDGDHALHHGRPLPAASPTSWAGTSCATT